MFRSLSQLFRAYVGRGAWLDGGHALGGGLLRLPLVRDPVPPLPAGAPKGCVFSCEWGKGRRDGSHGILQRKGESFVNMATKIEGPEWKRGDGAWDEELEGGKSSLVLAVLCFYVWGEMTDVAY
ncbi:hypothetical protein SODALDRAFT_4395 [Sodiomyces alkalinus F11]|uniref:Uncharacterized protein n=1 Tax=Sodiomyces alkalinus (strain CBS 110278 / VKM F-3762 / F11) TaxID=1314773 RepID=A0A3N2Q5B2_SODAK|nr:hypothetical protein SODALDRAFT_4395 [Sodiomyces alkalinus F11]ROT41964.1 hypothetical protein SODALDRAFT_4395 [Sodiomyces alkalinus F11]